MKTAAPLQSMPIRVLGAGTEFVPEPETGDRAHPQALCFSNEYAEGFAGFAGRRVLSVEFAGSPGGDNRLEHVLRRQAGVLIYTQAFKDSGHVTYCVHGQALRCARGSTEEARFLQGAIRSILKYAAQPLRSALEARSQEPLLVIPAWLSKAMRQPLAPPTR